MLQPTSSCRLLYYEKKASIKELESSNLVGINHEPIISMAKINKTLAPYGWHDHILPLDIVHKMDTTTRKLKLTFQKMHSFFTIVMYSRTLTYDQPKSSHMPTPSRFVTHSNLTLTKLLLTIGSITIKKNALLFFTKFWYQQPIIHQGWRRTLTLRSLRMIQRVSAAHHRIPMPEHS